MMFGFSHASGVDHMPAAGQDAVIGDVCVTTYQHVSFSQVHEPLKTAIWSVCIAEAISHSSGIQICKDCLKCGKIGVDIAKPIVDITSAVEDFEQARVCIKLSRMSWKWQNRAG
jgi:hypothetical protein